MKIYACAISANYRNSLSIVTDVFPVALKAENKQEAIGKALEIAFQKNPKENGYYNHQATVVEIPEHWIRGEREEGIDKLKMIGKQEKT